jgi:hypothetical protein
MKLTANEKLIGIETMKTRIELFHSDRCKRGCITPFHFEVHFRTQNWTCSKIVKEFRALPENQEQTLGNACDSFVPAPRTDAEMQELIKNCGAALTLG